MTEERRIQLVAEVDATGARAGLNQISREAGTMAAAVGRNAQEAEAAVAGIGGGAGRSAAQIEAAGRNLIGSIQRQTAAMEAGSRSGAAYYEVLARQRGIPQATIEPYLAGLRAQEALQTRATAATTAGTAATVAGSAAIGRLGVSAAQTNAAIRGIPAQFTDIVTSLQGGQAPLTVLLQQGGQLKDMFGGAGAAARALGGYVVGLVNPYTVAAAAAAGLGYAYYQGAEESKAYTKSIILSGNAAGVTAGQLRDAARTISQTVGTQGAAAEAVTALVATGTVAAANLEQFSTVAVKAQRTLGQSVEDTASKFAALAQAPSATLIKLNDQYHFLTASVYQQVRALEMQGRTYEAGQVAQQAFATGVDTLANKVTSNMGTIERALKGGADAWKSFWDSALNVGRQESLESQLATVQALIAKAQKPMDNTLGGTTEDRYARAHLDDNIALEQSLKAQIDDMNVIGAYEAQTARRNASALDWAKTKESYLTRQAQMENELAAIRNKGAAANAPQKEIDDALIAARRKYADIFNDGVNSNIEALKRRQAVEDAISKRSLARIAATKGSGLTGEEAAINAVAKEEDERFASRIKALKAEKALTADKLNSTTAQNAIQGQIDVLEEERITRRLQLGYDLQQVTRTSLGLYADQLDQLRASRDGAIQQVQDQKDYNEEIGKTTLELLLLKAARREELAVRLDARAVAADGEDLTGEKARLIRQEAAALRERSTAEKVGYIKERDPYTNLIASVKRYGEEASNTGAQVGDALTSGFRSAEDAFASFVTTGKIGFGSFASSIVAGLARIQAQKALAGIADYALNAFFGGISNAQVETSHATEMARINAQLDADLALPRRAAGGPVTGGASYLVGEKGPEVFTPSTSGKIIANHALGAGGGGDVTISMQTIIQNGSASTTSSGGDGTDARALADGLNAKFKQIITNEMRQGGLLWNMKQGRA